MSGFVQGSEVVEGNSPYEKFDITEKVGETELTFMMVGIEERKSDEWGPFKILTCVSFDPKAASLDAAVASAKLQSFVLNQVLLGKVENGLMVPNECYTVKYVLGKGDKYTDKHGKKATAKAHHFELTRLEVPSEGIDALTALVPGKAMQTGEPQPVEDTEPGKPGGVPKI